MKHASHAVCLFAGVCVGILLSHARPHRPPPAPPLGGVLLVSHPDPASPSGRRAVRLVPIPTPPEDEYGYVKLSADAWVFTAAGQTYYMRLAGESRSTASLTRLTR